MKTSQFALIFVLYLIANCRDRGPASGPDPECPATPCGAARGSFYFWKTREALPAPEAIARFRVDHLYVRLFDVDLDGTGRPVPVAPRSPVPPGYGVRVTPVIYLTVRSLRTARTAELAAQIVRLVRVLVPAATDLQLDCDWTNTSRAHYFALIEEIKKITKWKLSATIRLHQLKFHRRTGVPPVDRGVLMFYNMGDLRNPAETNSILNLNTAEPYLKDFNSAAYPLPLDLALPYFSWGVSFVHGAFFKLLPGLTAHELGPVRPRRTDGRFVLDEERVVAGVPLPAGTEIRLEQVTICDLNRALARLGSVLPADPARSLLLFDYDADKMNRPDLIDFLRSASGSCQRASHSYQYHPVSRYRPGSAALFVRARPAVSILSGRNCRRARESLAPLVTDSRGGG